MADFDNKEDRDAEGADDGDDNAPAVVSLLFQFEILF